MNQDNSSINEISAKNDEFIKLATPLMNFMYENYSYFYEAHITGDSARIMEQHFEKWAKR